MVSVIETPVYRERLLERPAWYACSRLQHAAQVLGVSVPFFFEGAPGGHKTGGDAPSPDYVNEFVSSEDGMRSGPRRRRELSFQAADPADSGG